MKTIHAFLILFFSYQGLAFPESVHRQSILNEKIYPYCNSPDDPSIPCDETYPNGTYIDGNRPNPDASCSNIFFMCTNGVSKCFNCQDVEGIRLYYDHPQLECDYRENVEGCTGVPESTVPSSSTSPATRSTESTGPTVPPGYICPADNGFFPIDPNQCLINYYVCVSGSPSIGTCPPGSLFDPAVLFCVPEDQTSCNSPTTTRTTTTERTTVPTVPPGYVCPNLNGFFPIKPDQCLPNYYICVNGAPSVGTCPPGSLFDPVVLYCVPEEQATCNFICPASNGFFPVPGFGTEQCFNGYIACVSFISYPMTCPGDSVFDPDLLFCVPPQDNGCVA